MSWWRSNQLSHTPVADGYVTSADRQVTPRSGEIRVRARDSATGVTLRLIGRRGRYLGAGSGQLTTSQPQSTGPINGGR